MVMYLAVTHMACPLSAASLPWLCAWLSPIQAGRLSTPSPPEDAILYTENGVLTPRDALFAFSSVRVQCR